MQFAAEYAVEHLITSLKTRVLEIKTLIKEGKSINRKDSFSSLKSKVPQSPSLEDRKKADVKPKKTISPSDDLKVLNGDTDILDNDLLLRLEKVLPVSKKVIFKADDEVVPTIDSEAYLESNGTINYNKLITDQVLATDKLLTEAAKKTRNIAGKNKF